MSIVKSKAIRGYLLAALAACSWAAAALVAKWLMTDPSAATTNWIIPPPAVTVPAAVLSADRAVLASIILLVIILFRNPQGLKVPLKGIGFFALFGIFAVALLHLCYFSAINATNASTAILMEYLSPVLIMLFGVLFLKERTTWRLPIAIVLALLGAALVSGAFLPGGLVISPVGIAFGLGAAVLFSTFSLMGRFASGRYNTLVMMTYGFCFADVVWFIVLGPDAISASLTDLSILPALIAVALLGSVIPTLLFFKSLSYIAAANATMTSILEPFAVAIGEFLLFGEALLPMQIVGGAVIILAVFIILRADLAGKQKPTKPTKPTKQEQI